jgi:CheY-like chemotaxis protein
MQAMPMQSISHKTILVVEDEPELRGILAAELRDAGYEVMDAPSGNAAIALLGRTSVDVVLSDVRMADGSGLDLVRWLRARHREKPPILLLSGFSDVSSEQAFHEGAAATLAKPLASEELLEIVASFAAPPDLRLSRQPEIGEDVPLVSRSFGSAAEADADGALQVGTGGAFVACESDLPECYDRLRFHFAFANGTVLDGAGVVRWIRRADEPEGAAGFGLEFSYLSGRALATHAQIVGDSPRVSYNPLGTR